MSDCDRPSSRLIPAPDKPFHFELLAHRAVYCLALSLRCSLDSRRLSRSRRNGKALFRRLLLQIGGANIENPQTSSLADETTRLLTPPPPHGGERFADARS